MRLRDTNSFLSGIWNALTPAPGGAGPLPWGEGNCGTRLLGGFGESAAFFMPALSLPLVGQDEGVDEGGKNALTPAPRRRRPSPVGRGEISTQDRTLI